MGLHRAALPELSGYAQKFMLGFTLCFDNKNPNGFLYSSIAPCLQSPAHSVMNTNAKPKT
jgi:hypothetical protein